MPKHALAGGNTQHTQKNIFCLFLHQNRPYSTNDILLNLHKEHGKTAIQKAIDLLVVEGKLTEKVRRGHSTMTSRKFDPNINLRHAKNVDDKTGQKTLLFQYS